LVALGGGINSPKDLADRTDLNDEVFLNDGDCFIDLVDFDADSGSAGEEYSGLYESYCSPSG
jgi:hypothetical protein